MGFYGNITNTSKTTFSFDHVYITRADMDKYANTDGVFLGRYVLVNYDEPPIKAYYHNGTFYNTSSYQEAIALTPRENVLYQDLNYNSSIPDSFLFYRWDESRGSYVGVTAQSNNSYAANFYIDVSAYGRGYDSTVWVKRYDEKNQVYKYVLIAELNAVIPTLHLIVDKPQQIPVTPYFDRDTSNIDYYLHMQANYGVRVKEGIEEYSDVEIKRTPTYWDLESSDRPILREGPEETLNGDIFFNKAGFDFATKTYIDPKSDYGIDTINYGMARSERLYGQDATLGVYQQGYTADDIYEWYIHLAGIGNAISTMWDRVYDDLGNGNTRALNKAAYRDDKTEHLVSYNKETVIGMMNTMQDLLGYYFIPLGTQGHNLGNSITDSTITVTPTIDYKYSFKGDIPTDIAYPVLSCLFYKQQDGKTQYYHYAYKPEYTPFESSLEENKTYYYCDDAGVYHLANPKTYNNLTADGKSTKMSTYYTREDKWILTELVAQTEDSLYSLIAEIHKILGTNADNERNIDTVKGSINIIKDIISNINLNLKPGTLLHVNNSGVIENTNTYYPSSKVDASRVLIGNPDETENKMAWENRVRSIDVITGSNSETSWDTQANTIDTNENNNNTISFTAGNKWVGLAADKKKQLVTIRHMKSDLPAHNFASDDDITINENLQSGDCEFKFNMPTTDNAGHVIGTSPKSIYIPFNYRNIYLDKQDTSDSELKPNSAQVSAGTTTDTFSFATGNKWIQANIKEGAAEGETDTLTFAHSLTTKEVQDVTFEPTESDRNGFQQAEEDNNALFIPTFTLDKAGHVVKKDSKTFYIPNNFRNVKAITIDSSDGTQKAVQTSKESIGAKSVIDTLSFAPQNTWLRIAADEKAHAITIGHTLSTLSEGEIAPNIAEVLSKTEYGNNTIIIPTFTTDAAGHVVGTSSKTCYIPHSLRTITVNAQSQDFTNDITGNADAFSITADKLADTFFIGTANKWIQTSGSTDKKLINFSHSHSGVIADTYGNKQDVKPAFGDSFVVPTYIVDKAGHITQSVNYNITIPSGSYKNNSETDTTKNVITAINFTSTSGEITSTSTALSDLVLTTYKHPEDIKVVTIPNNTSLKDAIARLSTGIQQNANNFTNFKNFSTIKINNNTILSPASNQEQLNITAGDNITLTAHEDEKGFKISHSTLTVNNEETNLYNIAIDNYGHVINTTKVEKDDLLQDYGLAPIQSPNFSGTPTINSTNIATITTVSDSINAAKLDIKTQLLNDLLENYSITLNEPDFTATQNGTTFSVTINKYKTESTVAWYNGNKQQVGSGNTITVTEAGEYYCIVTRTHNNQQVEKQQDGVFSIREEDLTPSIV